MTIAELLILVLNINKLLFIIESYLFDYRQPGSLGST